MGVGARARARTREEESHPPTHTRTVIERVGKGWRGVGNSVLHVGLKRLREKESQTRRHRRMQKI